MPRGRRASTPTDVDVVNTGNESETTDNSEITNTSHVYIGNSYLVTWRNGQIQPATIVDRRPVKKKHKRQSQDTPPPEPEQETVYEYYVHYTNFDRRLDEWVTIDRIDLDANVNDTDSGSASPRSKVGTKKMKRKLDDITGAPSQRDEKLALLSNLEKEYEEITKVKNIQTIEMGKFEIDTWYFSPYPEDYCGSDKLYICEYCLKYMKSKNKLTRHCSTCEHRSPPGREIYRENELSMYEIDGKDEKIYCQNLCLLSKLFLDHKTLYYDVDSFLFYVMCEVDEAGAHIVGYFSKEKHSAENYNLACILTFPSHQRKGYGKFLISVSYELTKREKTTGSPEKPLSDLGKITYRSYWAYVILKTIEAKTDEVTIMEITKQTGIRVEDITSTLHSLNLIKYWKGQHVLSISQQVVSSMIQQSKKLRLCDPACLHWEPPVAADKEKGSSKNK